MAILFSPFAKKSSVLSAKIFKVFFYIVHSAQLITSNTRSFRLSEDAPSFLKSEVYCLWRVKPRPFLLLKERAKEVRLKTLFRIEIVYDL